MRPPYQCVALDLPSNVHAVAVEVTGASCANAVSITSSTAGRCPRFRAVLSGANIRINRTPAERRGQTPSWSAGSAHCDANASTTS